MIKIDLTNDAPTTIIEIGISEPLDCTTNIKDLPFDTGYFVCYSNMNQKEGVLIDIYQTLEEAQEIANDFLLELSANPDERVYIIIHQEAILFNHVRGR